MSFTTWHECVATSAAGPNVDTDGTILLLTALEVETPNTSC
jgi:hypothetical protein